MYGRVRGVTVVGVRGRVVTVEAHIGRGLPSLTLAGLPGAAVQDARERIRPAVESAGLEWPLRRVVVNLAPGNLRKEGPGLDLPVAMGVLAASAQVPAAEVRGWSFVGELSLRGDLVSTPGVLSAAIATARAGLHRMVVPAPNAAEAALVHGLEIAGASSLRDVVGLFRGTWRPSPPEAPSTEIDARHAVDLAEVRGQAQARRALEIAAAGGHNVLLVGAPGALTEIQRWVHGSAGEGVADGEYHLYSFDLSAFDTSGAFRAMARMKLTVRLLVRNEPTMPMESMAAPTSQ